MNWSNKYFNQEKLNNINEKVQKFENDFHIDLLIVNAQSSDPYPAASYRVSIILSLFILAICTHFFDFKNDYLLLLLIFSSIFFNLLWIPLTPLIKLGYLYQETQREVKEKCNELFNFYVKNESEKCIFLYISHEERQVELRITRNLNEKLEKLLPQFVQVMTKNFKHGEFTNALNIFLESLEENLDKKHGKYKDIYCNDLRFVDFSR